MPYYISNIYFITAIAVVGGGLFGFDISSMSAIISTQQYLCYFNQGGITDDGKCAGPNSDVQGGITAAMPGGSYLGAIISGTFTSPPYEMRRELIPTLQVSSLTTSAAKRPS